MRPAGLSVIGIVAAVALSAAPAGAGLSVDFDLPSATASINANRVLAMPDLSTPDFLNVTLVDHEPPVPAILAGTSIPNAQIPLFMLDVTVYEPPTPQDVWMATGPLLFTDVSGIPKVAGWFSSRDVTLDGTDLVIAGALATQIPGPSDAILAGMGGSWEFDGADGSAVALPGGRSGYDNGRLTLTVHGVSTGSVYSVFHPDTPWGPLDAEVTGSVVPAPGALPLAAAGIALVGWLRRRAA